MRIARRFAFAAGLALLAGCDDEGSPSPPAREVEIEFADRFEGAFPNSNWSVEQGFPFVDEERGNSPPGLVLGVLTSARLHGTFTFSTSDPVTFSFDLSTPGRLTESDTRFAVRLRRDAILGGDASFEVRLKDGVIRFEILGQEKTFDFFTDAEFRTIAFSVDQGRGSWLVDGQPYLVLEDFPEDVLQVEFEAGGGMGLGFEVDNVLVTRP
jgi:hypothetical protein